MKKIFLAVTAILIVGLFVGCASTSQKSTLSQVERNRLNGVMTELQNMKNELYEVCDSPIITSSDYSLIGSIKERARSRISWERNGGSPYSTEALRELYTKDFPENVADPWFDEFVNKKKEQETYYNNFTGKIINESNSTQKFGIMVKTNGPTRWFYFEVDPNSEKYFTIPDVGKYKDTYIAIKHPKYWYVFNAGTQEIDKEPGFAEYSRYLLGTHSLEYTFNEEYIIQLKSDGHSLVNKQGLLHWKFVERFEEKNLLQEIDYDKLADILGRDR